jgi:hypothetical protein
MPPRSHARRAEQAGARVWSPARDHHRGPVAPVGDDTSTPDRTRSSRRRVSFSSRAGVASHTTPARSALKSTLATSQTPSTRSAPCVHVLTYSQGKRFRGSNPFVGAAPASAGPLCGRGKFLARIDEKHVIVLGEGKHVHQTKICQTALAKGE